jgi:hypothetical protein
MRNLTMRRKTVAVLLVLMATACIGFTLVALRTAAQMAQAISPAGIALALDEGLLLIPSERSRCLSTDADGTMTCTWRLNEQTMVVHAPVRSLLGFASDDSERRCSVIFAGRPLSCRSIVPGNRADQYVLIEDHGISDETLFLLRLEYLPVNLSASEWLWGMTVLGLLLSLSAGVYVYQYFGSTNVRKGLGAVFCAVVFFVSLQTAGFLLLRGLKLM